MHGHLFSSGGPCQLPSTPGLLRKNGHAIPTTRTPRAVKNVVLLSGGPCQLPGTLSFLKHALTEAQWPELPEPSSHKGMLLVRSYWPKAAKTKAAQETARQSVHQIKRRSLFQQPYPKPHIAKLNPKKLER